MLGLLYSQNPGILCGKITSSVSACDIEYVPRSTGISSKIPSEGNGNTEERKGKGKNIIYSSVSTLCGCLIIKLSEEAVLSIYPQVVYNT